MNRWACMVIFACCCGCLCAEEVGGQALPAAPPKKATDLEKLKASGAWAKIPGKLKNICIVAWDEPFVVTLLLPASATEFRCILMKTGERMAIDWDDLSLPERVRVTRLLGLEAGADGYPK